MEHPVAAVRIPFHENACFFEFFEAILRAKVSELLRLACFQVSRWFMLPSEDKVKGMSFLRQLRTDVNTEGESDSLCRTVDVRPLNGDSHKMSFQ